MLPSARILEPTPELVLGLPLQTPRPCLWQLLALDRAVLEWKEAQVRGGRLHCGVGASNCLVVGKRP